MGETGIIVRLPRTLNPTAKEFTPANHIPVTVPVAVGVPYPYFPAGNFSPPSHLSTSPTRSLLLTPVPLTSESTLWRDLEKFGNVRAVQTEALRYGIVTVHFYDLRHAETAFTAIRTHNVHYTSFFNSVSHPQLYAPPPPPPPPGLVAGCPIWAHFVLPAASDAFPDAHNQGTIVVFNLDSNVSAHHLRQLFETFGPIKEVRHTPWKKNQRFLEFFDIRDAAMALKQMNGKEIRGKPVVIEFSKPGGHGRRYFHSTYSPIPKKPINLNVPPPPSPPPFYHSQRRRFAPPFHSPQPQVSPKRRGSPNSGSLASSMGSMSLIKVEHSHGAPRRNFRRSQSRESTVGTPKQYHYQQVTRSRQWKGKQTNNRETRFLIKEDAIVESSFRDPRTTVMIKNIPNKYSQKLLISMLDNHCIHCNEQIGDGNDQPLSSYDFLYLPIDFNNKCNVGYGFVNMTSPEATLRLYKAFHLQHWEVFNSRKICEVTYAKVQGLEALKEHFKNSKFPFEMEHYLPVVFSPPRDGKELTVPLPIVGMMTGNYNKHLTCDEVESEDRVVVSEDVLSSKSGGVGDNDEERSGDLPAL